MLLLRIMQNGASGMVGQALQVDVVAHNLANVQTTAFKARRVGFADLPYQSAARPGMPVYPSRPPAQLGSGVAVAAISPDFAPGVLLATGRPFDVAIAGRGFLAVTLPHGEIAYTRDGCLAVAADGHLVHAGSGYPLADEIVIPEEAAAVTLRPDGRVMVSLPDGVTEAGRIQLYHFANPEGLVARGQNLWLAGEQAGTPQVAPPGEEGMGKLVPGMLEASNVDLATEMVALLLAHRAYQLNAKSVLVGDEMWALANELRR